MSHPKLLSIFIAITKKCYAFKFISLNKLVGNYEFSVNNDKKSPNDLVVRSLGADDLFMDAEYGFIMD